jgi:hypothetical protein
MSFSSVKEVISNGSLGAFATSGAFVSIPLVSGVASTASNVIALELGVWALNSRVEFITNADDTTEIESVVVTSLNEVGNVNNNTIIWNGSTAGAYNGATRVYNYTNIITATSNTLNEYSSQITWIGAGSAPSANIILNATKLV